MSKPAGYIRLDAAWGRMVFVEDLFKIEKKRSISIDILSNSEFGDGFSRNPLDFIFTFRHPG